VEDGDLHAKIFKAKFGTMLPETNRVKKNFRWYMRYFHNKIGFFIVGLVIIYGLSGLLQTYRDTNLLKHDVVRDQQLQPNLSESELANNLRIRNLKVDRIEGNTVYFKDGHYNKETGKAMITTKEWYSWLTPFTDLHKTPSKNIAHYFTTVFGIALLFMSISAFWMFKPATKLSSSGVMLTIAGIIGAIILLIVR
jgi:hypothetical protein